MFSTFSTFSRGGVKHLEEQHIAPSPYAVVFGDPLPLEKVENVENPVAVFRF